jgi:hypothetical protein
MIRGTTINSEAYMNECAEKPSFTEAVFDHTSIFHTVVWQCQDTRQSATHEGDQKIEVDSVATPTIQS